jgi:histidine triad (HIT) family protein
MHNKGVIMSEECIFCKIINCDFGTEFVYETENTVVFNDINPKAPIHMLVCPKKHVPSLNELEDKELMAELLQTVKDVTKKIGLKSYRTQINTGKEAGQEVFHLHIHILGNK